MEEYWLGADGTWRKVSMLPGGDGYQTLERSIPDAKVPEAQKQLREKQIQAYETLYGSSHPAVSIHQKGLVALKRSQAIS